MKLTIAANDLITNEAQIAKQLMVVRFAISQSTFFVVTMSQERFLALGTHEMLHMPMFAQCGHHPLFNRTTACAANWYTHFVMAT